MQALSAKTSKRNAPLAANGDHTALKGGLAEARATIRSNVQLEIWRLLTQSGCPTRCRQRRSCSTTLIAALSLHADCEKGRGTRYHQPNHGTEKNRSKG